MSTNTIEAFHNDQYTVGWICAIQEELIAARSFLDKIHGRPKTKSKNDKNTYVLGEVEGHNVVVTILPVYGTNSATRVLENLLASFPNVRIGLMVGIGGGAPSNKNNMRLGDVVVSVPKNGKGGVFQYRFGKDVQDESFQVTGHTNRTPSVILSAIHNLGTEWAMTGNTIEQDVEAACNRIMQESTRQKYQRPGLEDRLFVSDFKHKSADETCATTCALRTDAIVDRTGWSAREDSHMVFCGTIASADQVLKNAHVRDTLCKEHDVLCFEMEAAGLMQDFPCVAIRGICDYSDTHKNDIWQGHAAMSAAAYAKNLLRMIIPDEVLSEPKLALIEKQLTVIEDVTCATQAAVSQLQSRQSLDRLKEWLKGSDPYHLYSQALSQRYDSTGGWLREDNRFVGWTTGEHSFLWLYGIPGCGKTVFSSMIIELVSMSHMCLFFFFTFQERENLSLDQMLRSLIWQLCTKDDSVLPRLNELKSRCEDRQPTTRELEDTFSDMLRLARDVWIIVDALDECVLEQDAEVGKRSISWFKRIVEANFHNVHLLVTSREEHEIKVGFQTITSDGNAIVVSGTGVDTDINSYINHKLEANNDWTDKNKAEIRKALLKRADGMFRYVACQMRDLEDRISSRAIQKALTDLPKDLDETYARILARIHEDNLPDAIRVLQFLTHSRRPLTLDELVDVIAVDATRSPAFDPRNRIKDPFKLAQLCSSLVTFGSNRTKTELNLAHYTVQEFLVSKSIYKEEFGLESANAAIAMVCMSYLRSMEHQFDQDTMMSLNAPFPFYRYSAPTWRVHAVAGEKLVLDEIVKVFLEPERAFHYPHTASDRIKIISPIWFACNAGFSAQCLAAILRDRRSRNTDMNCFIEKGESDPYWGDPLCAAIQRRQVDNIQFLLSENVKVQFVHLLENYYKTAGKFRVVSHDDKPKAREVGKMLLGHENIERQLAKYSDGTPRSIRNQDIRDFTKQGFVKQASSAHTILMQLCVFDDLEGLKLFVAAFPEISKYALLRMYRPACKPLMFARSKGSFDLKKFLEEYIEGLQR